MKTINLSEVTVTVDLAHVVIVALVVWALFLLKGKI